MIKSSKTILALSTFTLAASVLSSTQKIRHPNIVLIITDNLVYSDLGFTGNPHVKHRLSTTLFAKVSGSTSFLTGLLVVRRAWYQAWW